MVFVIDGEEWTLDLREGRGTLARGAPPEKADITLTINGVGGASSQQQGRAWQEGGCI